MSQLASDDEIIRKVKKVIEHFLERHHGQYPMNIEDILSEMRKITGKDFEQEDAIRFAHKALSLVQEERRDTEPRPL